MDRRDFLEKSSLFGVAGLASATSNPLNPALERIKGMVEAPRIVPDDMDEYVGLIDRGMAHIASLPLAERFPVRGPDLEAREDLVRKSLRALFLTGMVGDLAPEAQTDPRIQDRLLKAAPEIDDAVLSMTEYLSGLTVTEKADLQAVMRHKDNPGMQISEALTDESALLGMSPQRRLQTRAMVTHVSWRFRNQPSDLVISEYVDKVVKLRDAKGSDLIAQRKLTARMGEEMFWKAQETQEEKTGLGGLPWGLKVMGLGVVTFAGGAAMVALGADAGLIFGTVGVLMFIVGLFALIIQGIRGS
jgi:hypothetical protein